MDTNILFSFFWKHSFTRGLIISDKLDLHAPVLALEQLNKYSEEILSKSKITREEFKSVSALLSVYIDFVPLEEYKLYLKAAKSLPKGLTKEELAEFLEDIDFFALALELNFPIWSNDRLFKKQDKIKVFSTPELAKELGL